MTKENQKDVEFGRLFFKLREALEKLRIPVVGLIEYRNQNALNFQLEKADDFLREISAAFQDASMEVPKVYRAKKDLWKDLANALEYEKEYGAKTNEELADALIEGPWANTFLFTRFSTLLEAASDMLRSDGELKRQIGKVPYLTANSAANTDQEAWKEQAERAQARLDEYEETARRILAEDCAPDEKHCTCVPALRAEIERLKKKIAELEDLVWDGEE